MLDIKNTEQKPINEKEDNEKYTSEIKPAVKQDQIHSLLFSREIGWQEIIYDLINTEQLDPWDINIVILTDRYLEKIQQLEEADFFVSSKVLLAAALLLRIKSEILLEKYIRSIDDILFGKKEEKKYSMERIELDEDIPELVPKSPLPRFRKISLQELMDSLNQAISTENRRIKKELLDKNALREAAIVLPKRKYNIKDKIKEIYDKLFGHLETNKEKKKVSYTDLIGTDREERIISFGPLLHLDNQQRVWLEQQAHHEEIYIWMKETFLQHNPDPLEQLRLELESVIKEDEERERLKQERKLAKKQPKVKIDKEQKKRIKKLNKDFENPMADFFDMLS